MKDEDQGARLTRVRFAQAPIELLESCVTEQKKGALFVYLWLWHYAGRDDSAWPSINRLALECRMNDRDTRSSLKWLCSEGWVKKEERPGATSIYHVRMENPSPKRGTPPPKGVSPKRGSTPLPQIGEGTPPPNGPPNKRTRTRRQEQINPPLDVPPQPQVAETPRKRDVPTDGKKPSKTFRPTAEDIPAELLPLQAELLGYWPEKAGSRSQGAWRMLLTELGKIQQAMGGGTAVCREQLEQATQCGWRSVTHRNWLAYGQQRQRPARMSRSEEAAENVIAFFKQHDTQETDQWPSTMSTSSEPFWDCSSSANLPSHLARLA